MLLYLPFPSGAPLVAISTLDKIRMLLIYMLQINALQITIHFSSPYLQLRIHWHPFYLSFVFYHLVMCTFTSLYTSLWKLPLPLSKLLPSLGWISSPRNPPLSYCLQPRNSSQIIEFLKKQELIRCKVYKIFPLYSNSTPKFSILPLPLLHASSTSRYSSAILEPLSLLFMTWLSLLISNPLWSVPLDHQYIHPPSVLPP